MDSSDSPPGTGGASHPSGEAPKSRLPIEVHDVLEQYFKVQQRPSTLTKKEFASQLGVPLDRINVSDDPSLLLHAYDMLT
jgi:hypothetical protein